MNVARVAEGVKANNTRDRTMLLAHMVRVGRRLDAALQSRPRALDPPQILHHGIYLAIEPHKYVNRRRAQCGRGLLHWTKKLQQGKPFGFRVGMIQPRGFVYHGCVFFIFFARTRGDRGRESTFAVGLASEHDEQHTYLPPKRMMSYLVQHRPFGHTKQTKLLGQRSCQKRAVRSDPLPTG